MKETVKQLENFYKIALVAPAMLGLGVLVLCGLVVFAWDNKNNKG